MVVKKISRLSMTLSPSHLFHPFARHHHHRFVLHRLPLILVLIKNRLNFTESSTFDSKIQELKASAV
jgi:hypothetical protein